MSGLAERTKRQLIREQIRRAIAEQWPVSRLADALEVSYQMARYYLRREGYEVASVIRPIGSEATSSILE